MSTDQRRPSQTYPWKAFGSVWDDDMPEAFYDVQWVLTGEVSADSPDAAQEAIGDLLADLRLNEDGIDVNEPVEKGSWSGQDHEASQDRAADDDRDPIAGQTITPGKRGSS